MAGKPAANSASPSAGPNVRPATPPNPSAPKSCVAGFKLTEQINKRSDDFLVSLQAADAAISQGKKMIRYGLALKRKLHALV